MITGRRSQFESRCRQRGYTLDQVMPCVVSQDGDLWTVDESHPAYPHPRRGLGDLVHAGLQAVGITPARVSRLLGRPCGCNRRRQLLNRWGRRLGLG